MKDDEVDRMLREIPKGSPPDVSPLDDGLLLAWRAGKLPEAEAKAVEERLAQDPEARALLAELSADIAPNEVEALLSKIAPPAQVIPLRRGKPFVWGSVIAAIAAGLLAVVALWPAKETGRYQLEFEGGEMPTRGSTPAERVVLGDETRLTLRLRSEVATEAPRVLGVFLEGANGKLSRVGNAHLTAAHGSFEARIEGGAWAGDAGVHRVWLHVAKDEPSLRQVEGQTQAASRDEGLGWWSLEVERRVQ